MNFPEKPSSYYTFLLTLLEERSVDPAKPAMWRFRLEILRTGERCGFTTLEEVMAFLKDQMRDRNETEKALP
jgi:hypothetical protein